MKEKSLHFRSDKTKFKISTFEEADNNLAYWLSKSPKERLCASWYLTCCAYGLDYTKNHPVDRTVFTMKKRSE